MDKTAVFRFLLSLNIYVHFHSIGNQGTAADSCILIGISSVEFMLLFVITTSKHYFSLKKF